HRTDQRSACSHGHLILSHGGRYDGSDPTAVRMKSHLHYLAGRHPETDATHLQLFTPAALRRLLDVFDEVDVRFAVGRYVRWQPRLMARVQVFSARKPG